MPDSDRALLRTIFHNASRTFYWTSRLFPADIRNDVEALYAFVRLADNCVDEFPQDARRLDDLQEGYRGSTLVILSETDAIVTRAFREMAERRLLDPAWVDAFFRSMRMDLAERPYQKLDDTLAYIYGSAEVIGLMMARIMNANPSAERSAALLGRGFQYINMIRDIGTDQKLGRTYIPAELLTAHGLPDLSEETARARAASFTELIHAELDRYRAWQAEGEAGISALPPRCRPAVRAACAAYCRTADAITADPYLVYGAPYRPSRMRLLLEAIFSFRA